MSVAPNATNALNTHVDDVAFADAFDVHAEMRALSTALLAQRHSLGVRLAEVQQREAEVKQRESEVEQREAEVERRSADGARDRQILQSLLAKEASRLLTNAQERLEAAASAQVSRLEAACSTLRQLRQNKPDSGCDRLPEKTDGKFRPRRPLQEAPPQPSQLQGTYDHQLERARELTASLLLELDAVERFASGILQSGSDAMPLSRASKTAAVNRDAARLRGLPGAAEALLNDASLGAIQRLRLLRLLWDGLTQMMEGVESGEGSSNHTGRTLAQWERRLTRYLSRAAAADSEPLFGRTIASATSTAPLAALLLLRLSQRAQQSVRKGATTAGDGVRDTCEALGCIRRLASDPVSRGSLIHLNGVEELMPLVGHAIPTIARGAAACLVGLCATAEDGAASIVRSPIERLALPAFMRAAATALRSSSATTGEESLAACVSVLLQRLSIRRANRHLFEIGDLRRTLHSLAHTPSSILEHHGATSASNTSFLLANWRSILQNTEPSRCVVDSPSSRLPRNSSHGESIEGHTSPVCASSDAHVPPA